MKWTTIFLIILFGCLEKPPEEILAQSESPYIVVLGVAQDAGYPQIGCYEDHCLTAWKQPERKRKVVSLGLVDPANKKKWLFEATPDIKEQLFEFQKFAPDSIYEFAGIFLTHGHMGHYAGLMQLGKEAISASNIPVYAMPKMIKYLSSNGPWDQLVKISNINLSPLQDSLRIDITDQLSITPFEVPHRDEYTETVGYNITGPSKSLIFIPDIDKWSDWHVNLAAENYAWDYALVDATFFNDGELPGRDMSKIKHPFVSESFEYFKGLSSLKRKGVHFIHFNHTNPLLIEGSEENAEVLQNGFNVAAELDILPL
ncbi:MAG: MBL fold metallo-hydrolase [Cyclobacteriaceae bacterium]